MTGAIQRCRGRAWIVGTVLFFSSLLFYLMVPAHQSVSPSWLGLAMRDERLVAAVRGRLVQPASQSTPYNLSRPDQTYYAQYGQDKIVAQLLDNKTGGFFLEAGALNGEYLSNTLYLERSLGWTGILVEPNPITFEKMKSKNRKAYLLNAGFSIGNTSMRSYLDFDGKYPELAKLQVANSPLNANQLAQVDCFPLFTVLEAAGNPLLDLLVLDVEGVEFKVLRAVPWAEVRVRLLLVETVHVPEGLKELDLLLTENGFIKHRALEVDVLYYHPDYFHNTIVKQPVTEKREVNIS